MPSSSFEDIDVIILTETWSVDGNFDIAGFYSVKCPAEWTGVGHASGGVAIFYNQRLGSMQMVCCSDNCIVVKGERLNIISMYVKPKGTEETNILVEKLTKCIKLIDNKEDTLICGDFNARLDKPNESRTERFYETLHDFGFWVINDLRTPTFIGPRGKSIIDVFATNLSSSRVKFLGQNHQMREAGNLTCHVAVGVDIKLRHSSIRPRPRQLPVERRLDCEKLLLTANPTYWPQDEVDVDEHFRVFSETVNGCVAERRGKKDRPWWNRDCSNAKSCLLQVKVLSEIRPGMSYLFPRYKNFYRQTLKTAKKIFEEKKEIRLINLSREKPYLWLRQGDRPRQTCPIESSVLMEHFGAILKAKDTTPKEIPAHSAAWSEEEEFWRTWLGRPFTEEEVSYVIRRAPNKKATGPDRICNEHLKTGKVFVSTLTSLFNKCLMNGKIPEVWRDCVLSIIPKGKGPANDPKSWRGIARKSCVYKILSSLIVSRLSSFLEDIKALPDEQHGFRHKRSTMTACEILLREISETRKKKKQYLYCTFVDFRSAFETGSRSRALERLSSLGVPQNLLILIGDILQRNTLTMDDGVAEIVGLEQTNGYSQGDNLSPLLFILLLADLPSCIQMKHSDVRVLLYADDLAIYSRSHRQMQKSLNTLSAYVDEIGMEINADKTKATKFRGGGFIPESDKLYLNGTTVEYVNNFTYLGLVLSTSGNSFTKHIEERAQKSAVASYSVSDPRKLSVKTALMLFDLKIAPVASYGVPLVWDKLTTANLSELERVKTSYLKRMIGVDSRTPRALVYLMTGTRLFVDEIKQRFSLPETSAWKEFIFLQKEKWSRVDKEFYSTGAMVDSSWKELNRPNRHLVTRFAAHGFHHLICIFDHYHDPTPDCRCMLCGDECERYHAQKCFKIASISSLARLPRRS